jgi:hypothetical protein
MAARHGDAGSSATGHGSGLLPGGRSGQCDVIVGRSRLSHPDIQRVDHHNVVDSWRFERFHHDGCCWRIHNDDSGWRFDHHVNLTVDLAHGGSRTRTCPHGPDAAPRQLDEPGVHDDRCGLEHRLGVQMRARTSQRAIAPGIRDSGRVVSQRNARDQRDRAVRAVGHDAVHPWNADTGRAGAGNLYLGGQGHRLVGRPIP